MRQSIDEGKSEALASDQSVVSGRRESGFSVLEVIAVLGLLSIIAGIVVPPMIARIDQEMRSLEEDRLKELSRGIEEYVKGELEVPNTNTWSASLAEQVGMSPGTIEQNQRGRGRRFLIHPGFQGQLTSGQSSSGLAETNIESAQILILSSLYESLPEPQNIVNSVSDFDDIWTTSSGTVPNRLADDLGWEGNPDDLMIKKVDLKSMFKEIVLRNLDDSQGTKYWIDGSPQSLSAGSQISGYFLKGTLLGFGASSVASSPDAEEIVEQSVSYFFLEGEWHTSFPGQPGIEAWMMNYMRQLRDWIDYNNLKEGDISQKGGPKFHLQGKP